MVRESDDRDEKRIVIDLADSPTVRIGSLDVGVAEGVIAFDVTGVIDDMEDGRLDELNDSKLRPVEVHFLVEDDSEATTEPARASDSEE